MQPGHEAWVTRDYGGDGKGLNLSKARLGEFVYDLLRFGGSITSIYAMNASFPRCYVQAVVTLPTGKRDDFVAETGFALDPPVVLSPPISREPKRWRKKSPGDAPVGAPESDWW